MRMLIREPFCLRGLAAVALALWLQSSTNALGDGAKKNSRTSEKSEPKKDERRDSEAKKDSHPQQAPVKDKGTTPEGEKVVEQVGEASWYGPNFHGKKTASGETFDQHDLTAAHPTLPLGSEATVTNLKTGQSVDVRINDRGPYTKGREIDLSKSAAKEIGMKKEGTAPVKIEATVPPNGEKNEASDKDKGRDNGRKKN